MISHDLHGQIYGFRFRYFPVKSHWTSYENWWFFRGTPWLGKPPSEHGAGPVGSVGSEKQGRHVVRSHTDWGWVREHFKRTRTVMNDRMMIHDDSWWFMVTVTITMARACLFFGAAGESNLELTLPGRKQLQCTRRELFKHGHVLNYLLRWWQKKTLRCDASAISTCVLFDAGHLLEWSWPHIPPWNWENS